MAKLADGYPKPRPTPEQLADMLDNATRYTMQRSILIDLDTARFISDALRDLAVRAGSAK